MPTALELTREERERYVKAVQRRPPRPALMPDEQAERDRLLERIRVVAATLKTRFGVRRVILFGSLAHGA